MVTLAPGIYVGWLRHRRYAQVTRRFTYPTFMVFLDIDRIPRLMAASRFTAYNRTNWASFHERDHFGDPRLPLRQRLTDDARRHGHVLPDGPIYLLTHLRYAGYCFNPVSFYYCFDRRGTLAMVMAEVNNTFGGAKNYWLTPESEGHRAGAQTFTAEADKALYVSPFLPDGLRYRFTLTVPGRRSLVHIRVEERGVKVLDATLSLERRPWTAAALRQTLMRYPVMTLQVIAAIHWEAVRLWWRGVAVVPRRHPQGLAAPVDGSRHTIKTYT